MRPSRFHLRMSDSDVFRQFKTFASRTLTPTTGQTRAVRLASDNGVPRITLRRNIRLSSQMTVPCKVSEVFRDVIEDDKGRPAADRFATDQRLLFVRARIYPIVSTRVQDLVLSTRLAT